MSLWEDIQPYLDPETGLLMAPDGGKDNLVLLSAYLSRELKSVGEHLGDSEIFLRAFDYIAANKVERGLYRKCPGGNMSPDNLIGMCSFGYAPHILDRWNDKWGCFDCDNPNKFAINRYWYSWHIGMKQFVAQMKDGTCGKIGEIIWGLSCLFTCLTTSGSSDALTLSLQVDAFEKANKSMWAVRYFRKKFDIATLYAEWFKSTNHPLVVYRNYAQKEG